MIQIFPMVASSTFDIATFKQLIPQRTLPSTLTHRYIPNSNEPHTKRSLHILSTYRSQNFSSVWLLLLPDAHNADNLQSCLHSEAKKAERRAVPPSSMMARVKLKCSRLFANIRSAEWRPKGKGRKTRQIYTSSRFTLAFHRRVVLIIVWDYTYSYEKYTTHITKHYICI